MTNTTFSRESNYIADMVMWATIVNSSIYMREVIITSKGFDQKHQFFERCSWFKLNSFRTAIRCGLKILQQCDKGVKTKSQTVFGVWELVGEVFLPPCWIGLTMIIVLSSYVWCPPLPLFLILWKISLLAFDAAMSITKYLYVLYTTTSVLYSMSGINVCLFVIKYLPQRCQKLSKARLNNVADFRKLSKIFI